MDESPRAAAMLHIEPTGSGRWAVCCEPGKRVLSDHLTANEAKHFAKQRARSEGIESILVHDAYFHTREVPNCHVSFPA